MRKFAVGDIVVVSAPPGEVIGEVLHASTPDEMPDLGPGSGWKGAKDAIREQHVDLILLIGHRHDDQQVCFFAIHNPNGWTDLHGQKLTVLKGDP